MFGEYEPAVWSVGELTDAIKGHLETGFPMVKVEGEVSNCRPSGAGHVYFTLKDSRAMISAALFRGRAAASRVKPADGMKVVVEGKIDVYPPRGSYQIIVTGIRSAGRGELLEALERRKHMLAAEGLFNQEFKKPLPPYPRRVAVITSPTGAAVRDILKVLSRRSAAPQVTILPTAVQGTDAAPGIVSQIRRAEAYNLGDVVILARGGGALEDLLAFSEESVVRAVAACKLPVITGVGHEVDISLADLAADVRAATPSAAAELVSDRSEDLLIRTAGFRKPAEDLIRARIDAARGRMQAYGGRELRYAVQGRLEEAMRRSDEAAGTLATAAGVRLDELSRRMELAVRTLQEASPQAVMARGYARVHHEGTTVTDAASLEKGMVLNIDFAEGQARAAVTEIGEK